MTNKNLTIGLVIAMIIAVGGYFFPQIQTALGGGTRFPNGISTDTTSPTVGQIRGTTLAVTGDTTLSGGTLTVATSNSATSTVTGGCFQFYATSTATAHNFQASTTPGIMYSSYGTCPNL